MTFGSPAAFAAGSVWRGNRAKQSNTPSVSRQKQAADTSDVTTSRIARNQRFRLPGRLREGAKIFGKSRFIVYPVEAKPLFTSFSTQRKSAFRSANNEMIGGLASGGALKCGEHCQTPSHEVSRAYKRRFQMLRQRLKPLPTTSLASVTTMKELGKCSARNRLSSTTWRGISRHMIVKPSRRL